MSTPLTENTERFSDDRNEMHESSPLVAPRTIAATAALDSDSPETQIEGECGSNNSKEIVRGIASYLSLSDVESIGSLYSMISPPAYHHHTYTPRIRKIGSASPGINGSHRFLQGQAHNRYGSTATLASIDDCANSDDDSEVAGLEAGEGISMIPSSSVGISNASGNIGKWHAASNHVADDCNDDALETPGLIALSPIRIDEDESDDSDDESYGAIIPISPSQIHDVLDCTGESAKKRTAMHMKMIQEKLKDAVFSHPHSIRSYCQASHRSAVRMKEKLLRSRSMPSNLMYTSGFRNVDMGIIYNIDHHTNMEGKGAFAYYLDEYGCDDSEASQEYTEVSHQFQPPHERLLRFLASSIFDNIPLSVLFDISYQSLDTTVKVTRASMTITTLSSEAIICLLANIVHNTIDAIGQNLNPFTLLNNIFQFQREAMEKTGEVIVTGIQSVASAGNACMHVFSKADKNYASSGGLGGIVSAGTRGSPKSGMVSVGQSLVEGLLLRSSGNVREVLISEKMFRKLNKINPAGKVVKYVEGDDEVLTQHAKKRVQRMMHYSVPLRPFVATVSRDEYQDEKNCNNMQNTTSSIGGDRNSISEDESDSPFMCTPKSFPPTPSSRAHVLARGTRFAEDVVFLARDQLRVEEGLHSENEQTKAMATALREGKRLAVFNASDVSGGIFLSCGQHRATKVGNDLYSSARGMIPMLRNSFVYFEMTISTPPLLSMVLHHASLSIGLSTLEMPLNALVGAWKGSVGICSTGQILAGGQWCSPMNPKTYGSNSTVGCLVYLDDDSAFETWDGVVCTANIVFNVDGEVIVPLSPENREHACDDDEDKEFSPVLPIFVPSAEELFPTLTLHSSQTEVLCRFCSEDILAISRKSVGAPSGVTVYAVDGSVLFDDDLSTASVLSNDDDTSCSVDSSHSFDSIGICIDDELEEKMDTYSA